jgi:hypothetical protein
LQFVKRRISLRITQIYASCLKLAGFSDVVGGAEEDRTPDLRIANATLSQLSYRPNEAKILAQGTVEASAAANGTGGLGQTTT